MMYNIFFFLRVYQTSSLSLSLGLLSTAVDTFLTHAFYDFLGKTDFKNKTKEKNKPCISEIISVICFDQ